MVRTAERGLSTEEATRLLASHGHNELPQEHSNHLLRLILATLREPMILLLLVTAVLYGLLGDGTESALLIASALVVIGIDLIQEFRSSRALQALKDLASPRALVLRDDVPVRIPAREVVPNDILVLSEGDRVAADAQVLSNAALSVDESLLTGESVPVHKSSTDPNSIVHGGSLVVRGSGIARVTATGAHTEMGKIGAALAAVQQTKSPLQRETTRLVRLCAIAGLGFCVIVIVMYGLLRGSWIEATLTGIALAMSLLPEEFPVVLSVFLALGARRLAASGLLVHRMPAVEGLGTITVLCVDKTGTLTMNEMTVAAVEATKAERHSITPERILSNEERELLSTAQYATKFPAWDPMDKAVQTAARLHQIELPTLSPTLEHPVTSELPAMIHCYADDERSFIAVKGMPEAVLKLCRQYEAEQLVVLEHVTSFAAEGMRVLGVARASTFTLELPIDNHEYEFLGLLAFHDPLRPGVPAAVRECYGAGIRVVMITGDYPVTASTIAGQAGIANSDRVLTGSQLLALNGEALKEELQSTNVFARINPMQKLQIVEVLKQSGAIVGMTGDGVNDAPALKAAHIGIAMGARGTDVAREAAAVVLTKDDFPSLARAIRQGRRTYDNIKKAMYYVLAMHIPIAGLSVLPLFTGLPIIFYPIHIVLLELIIDPVSAIVFEAEPEEATVMQRPPRDPRKSMFTRSHITIALLQGISILVFVGAVYLISFYRTHSEFESRTLAFATLVLSNLTLAMVNRSWTHTFLATLRIRNAALWFSIVGGLVLLFLITAVKPLSTLFHFGPFHFVDWILTAAVAAASLTWFELLKLLRRDPIGV